MDRDPTTDGKAFLSLLEPLERDLEVYCRRLIWEPNSVQDALQNAVARAFKAFSRYRPDASFRAWMFQILTREVFALNRKHARRTRFEFQLEPEELDALEAPSGTSLPLLVDLAPKSIAACIDDQLLTALRTLTENERAVLLLHSIGGFRYREIAEVLEMPMGSVMGFLARARRKMRDRLKSAQKQPQPHQSP